VLTWSEFVGRRYTNLGYESFFCNAVLHVNVLVTPVSAVALSGPIPV
jgi:hypothetical protein